MEVTVGGQFNMVNDRMLQLVAGEEGIARDG